MTLSPTDRRWSARISLRWFLSGNREAAAERHDAARDQASQHQRNIRDCQERRQGRVLVPPRMRAQPSPAALTHGRRPNHPVCSCHHAPRGGRTNSVVRVMLAMYVRCTSDRAKEPQPQLIIAPTTAYSTSADRRPVPTNPGFPSNRGDFGCGDHGSTGWPCCARLLAGQACGLPAFAVPRGRSGLRGQGRPAGPSPAGRCAAPWRPEGRPRTLSGRDKASGGEAASFARSAQRARRGHAASFPASDRS
jgi:hypothetical protein